MNEEDKPLFMFIDCIAVWAENDSIEKYIAACNDATELYNDVQNEKHFPFLASCYNFTDVMNDYFDYKGMLL